jgi:Calcineurin-like phosphoesterase
MTMADPGRVIVAGDWHGNLPWAASQLAAMRAAVPDEGPLLVLHAGDFGFWPGSSFARDVTAIARELGIRVLVTPGNHEDYRGQLPAWEGSAAGDAALVALPRGTRWTWHGHRWLSCGGATSPDRAWRAEGVNWWPEEELTPAEVTAAIMAGPADVLITHDAGDAVALPLGPWPRGWGQVEHQHALAHRRRVQRLADGVVPGLWVHGHYHLHASQSVELGWHGRQCAVTSLSCDGTPGNWGILDARSLTWEAFNA